MKDQEYKILEGLNEDNQKILNQWKHLYTIRILGMTSTVLGQSTILLIRERIVK